ncbi:MAG: acyloxyacyl hydrolase [Bacteroidetes bacterium]|nr:acyloxyacyl hydrolase [Bacteroidota bacterium]
MRLVFFIACFITSIVSFAQKTADTINVRTNNSMGIGAGLHYGFIFAHTKEVENTDGSKPYGIEVDFFKQLIKNPAWDECRCYPRTGLVLSYFDFDSRILGKGINAGWYVEPFFSVKHRLNISMKGVAGVSYLNKPYNTKTNPENNSYSTRVSFYLAMGLGLNFKINSTLSTKLSAYYNHSSNGAVKEPNKGINWPATTLHVYYTLRRAEFPEVKKKKLAEYRKLPVRKEAYMFASQRLLRNENTHYFITGAGFNSGKQISGMNALTAGVEAVADYTVRKRLERDGGNENNFLQAGINLGHEFLMGKFTFSQQLGIYILEPSGYFDDVYQRYGLTYFLNKHLGAGISLKAHRQVAAFLDGRVLYRF